MREKLFAAIEEGRFEAIQPVAVDYRKQVSAQLAAADPEERESLLTEALRPLQDALHLLRVVRAHYSTQYQNLAPDFAYRSFEPTRRWRTLNVDG
jgi:hypothetical protein